MNDFWSSCLTDFQRDLPPAQYEAWIRTLRVEMDPALPNSLRLLAPNPFVLDWVRKRYLEKIRTASQRFFGIPYQINLLIDPGASAQAPVVETEIIGVSDAAASQLVPPTDVPPTSESAGKQTNSSSLPKFEEKDPGYRRSKLRRDFTFDMLVGGRANEMARASAQHVALNPGSSYNPLFIYGSTGLGKTHLIHAIGNAVWQNQPQARVLYIHAAEYVNDFIRALQQKSFEAFKKTYHELDLLLIDDIQFFNGKERTQEEFFYTFNTLIGSSKQIVITCDTYAKDIQGMDDRLVSRFSSGLLVQVQPPDLEMRVAILKKKAAADDMTLDDEVAFLIAKNLRSNVRDLEGALKRVYAYSSFKKVSLDVDLAREALKDIIGAHNRQITIELIQKTVADYYKLRLADIFSPRRSRAIARPRQIAMWIARELTPHSLPDIGNAFGGRDHTTVMHACRTIAELREKDEKLRTDLNVLIQTVKG